MKIDLISHTPSVALADYAKSLKASGREIIELQTGDPEFKTHPDIISAAHGSLQNGNTHYSTSGGIPELRGSIAKCLNIEFNLDLDLSNILITHGAVQGIYAVIAALIEQDDEVIILEPNWPTVDSIVTICGGVPKKASYLKSDHELVESLDHILTKKTKMLCINSPSNPTGFVFSSSRVKLLLDWCSRNDLYLLSDEVYRSIIFEQEHASVIVHLNDLEKIIFIDSFSKKYAMTGWRIGYVCANKKILIKIGKASQVQITHVAPFIQQAALMALKSDAVSQYTMEMVNEYSERRDKLMHLCELLELDCIKPEGAFYLFIDVGVDDAEYSRRLLNDHDICVTPGSAYGKAGENYIRVSFAAGAKKVASALERIAKLTREWSE